MYGLTRCITYVFNLVIISSCITNTKSLKVFIMKYFVVHFDDIVTPQQTMRFCLLTAWKLILKNISHLTIPLYQWRWSSFFIFKIQNMFKLVPLKLFQTFSLALVSYRTFWIVRQSYRLVHYQFSLFHNCMILKMTFYYSNYNQVYY